MVKTKLDQSLELTQIFSKDRSLVVVVHNIHNKNGVYLSMLRDNTIQKLMRAHYHLP